MPAAKSGGHLDDVGDVQVGGRWRVLTSASRLSRHHWHSLPPDLSESPECTLRAL
jgi:hypothetical protein